VISFSRPPTTGKWNDAPADFLSRLTYFNLNKSQQGEIMKNKLAGLASILSLALCVAAPAQAADKTVLRLGFEVSLDSAQGVGGKEMARVAGEM
jgi:hypothetical protein